MHWEPHETPSKVNNLSKKTLNRRNLGKNLIFFY